MKILTEECKNAFHALGKVHYGLTKTEEKNKRFRRSIFVVQDVSKGEKFTDENIRIIRPGNGLSPKYINQIIGRISKKNISKGTPFRWNHIQ